MSSITNHDNGALTRLEGLAFLVMSKQFPSDFTEGHVRDGHFQLLKASATVSWKTQRLPHEIIYQVLLAIEPNACFRHHFVEPPQWNYVYDQDTMLACNIHDDKDVDDNDEDSNEELRVYYDEEWGHDHLPYVSGGLPANVDDNYDDSDDEEPGLWYDEEWMQYDYMPYVSEKMPPSLFDLEEEPLVIGGRSIFAPCVGAGAPASLFDYDEGPLLIGGKSIFEPCVSVEASAFFFDSEYEPLSIGSRNIFTEL